MQFETLGSHIAEGLSADNQLRTQEKGQVAEEMQEKSGLDVDGKTDRFHDLRLHQDQRREREHPVGVHGKVFLVSQNRVQQRVVEQIIAIFSLDRVHQRSEEQNLDSPRDVGLRAPFTAVNEAFRSISHIFWVLVQFSPGNLDIFNEPLVPGSHSPQCSCDSPWRHLEDRVVVWTYHIASQSICVRNNNNSIPIWGGSVFTGEEPPPHSGELTHALSQVCAAIPPSVVMTHLHGAPTTEETSTVKL